MAQSAYSNKQTIVSGAQPNWWLAGAIPSSYCVAAYQPKGAADLASSYINLANPGTYNAAPGTAPGFDTSLGWLGKTTTGLDSYLTTGIVPPGSGVWSLFVRATRAVTTNAYHCGCGNTGFFALYCTSTQRCYRNGGNLGVVAAFSSGVMGFAGTTAYYNGVVESGTGDISAGTIGNFGIYLMALNQNNSPSVSWYGNIQAVAIYNVAIHYSQALALTNAMNAL